MPRVDGQSLDDCPTCGQSRTAGVPAPIVQIESGRIYVPALIEHSPWGICAYMEGDLRRDGTPRGNAFKYFVGVNHFPAGHPRVADLHGEWGWYRKEREIIADGLRREYEAARTQLEKARQMLLALYAKDGEKVPA